MKRAERRHHNKRIKKNRRIHWGRKLNEKELGSVVDTPTPCSCPMCGNPRRHFGTKTVQEIRAEQEYK
jgi:rubrerythrin